MYTSGPTVPEHRHRSDDYSIIVRRHISKHISHVAAKLLEFSNNKDLTWDQIYINILFYTSDMWGLFKTAGIHLGRWLWPN